MREKTINSHTVFKGHLLKLDAVDVELVSGRQAKREIVRHPGAVVVLARLPDGRYAFVRQFRKPIEQVLLEVVAGTRNPGEDARSCAIRETREETGYEVKKITSMGFLYTTPGFCNERIDLFFAELSKNQKAQMTDEDENLEVVLLRQDEIEAMIAKRQIHDSKTLAAWLTLQYHLSAAG